MVKFLRKLICKLNGHKFGAAHESALKMIKVTAVYKTGESVDKDIPGFYRDRQCERCGDLQVEVVFTPSLSKAEMAEPNPETWN